MFISKELFFKSLNTLKESYDEIDQIENSMKPFFDGVKPTLTIGQGARDIVNDLLVQACRCFDEDDIFLWWLFDSSPKVIYINQGKDDEVRYDVSTPGALYDYLYDMYHSDD